MICNFAGACEPDGASTRNFSAEKYPYSVNKYVSVIYPTYLLEVKKGCYPSHGDEAIAYIEECKENND